MQLIGFHTLWEMYNKQFVAFEMCQYFFFGINDRYTGFSPIKIFVVCSHQSRYQWLTLFTVDYSMLTSSANTVDIYISFFKTIFNKNRSQTLISTWTGRLIYLEKYFIIFKLGEVMTWKNYFLRFHGPRRPINPTDVYVYQAEKSRNRSENEVHVSRLNFYSGGFVDNIDIMSAILSSERICQFYI